MLHNERPIELDEISNLLFTVYHIVDRLDQEITSRESRHISIFVSKYKEINRIAVGKCYNLINEVRDHNKLQPYKFLYFNKPTEDLLDKIDLIKKKVDHYFQSGQKNDYHSITTYLFGELAGYLSFLVHSTFELCISYELSQLKAMPSHELIKTLKEKIQRVEDLKFYTSESTNDIYQLFLNRQLEMFSNLLNRTISMFNKSVKPDLHTIFDKINNDDLEGAFDLLDLLNFSNNRGTYIQLQKEFIDMPQGVSRGNLRERLSIFVKTHI